MRAYSITKFQIRKIHFLKNLLGIDEETYREMLRSFDVSSSKNLTYTEAKILLEILEDNAEKANLWVKRGLKYDDPARAPFMASGAQRRMIEGLWRELSYKDSDIFAKQSLRKFLKQKFNVEDTSFLTKEKATKVIPGNYTYGEKFKGCGRICLVHRKKEIKMDTEKKVLNLIKDKQATLEENLAENSKIFAEGLLQEEKPENLKDMMASLNKVANSARNFEVLRAKISVLKELEAELTKEFQNSTIDTLINA